MEICHSIDEIGELKDSVSLVTGGGRGIGRAIACALAKNGSAVAVVSRTEGELAETVDQITEAGGRAIALPTDVSDPEAVQRMASETLKLLGAVNVLVNCAGITGPLGPVWEIDGDAWWQCMEVNLRGSFLCTRAFIPLMISRGCGRIINITSAAGLGGFPYSTAYSSSKTALVRFSEVVAREAGEFGVKVFSVNPGIVRTKLTELVIQTEQGEKYAPWVCQAIKEGRDIDIERAADLVAFIAGGKADELSGCNVGVYGNIHELVDRAQEIQENDFLKLRLRMDSSYV